MKFFFLAMILTHTYLGAQLPSCFNNVEREFFSYPVVAQAFSNNNIQQAYWPVLYQQLQQNAGYVPAIVEQTAQRMNPNPLNPFQPLAAADLLKTVLFRIFHDTMIVNQSIDTNRIIHESDINQMFRFIRAKQNRLLTTCFGIQSEADMKITE